MVDPVSEEEHYVSLLRMLDEFLPKASDKRRGVLRLQRIELADAIKKKNWPLARRIVQKIYWVDPDDHL